MSSEWTSCLLENVLEVKYGKDHKKLGQGAIPVYGSGGVMRYADAALYDDESILIPRKGSLNNVLFESKPFWTVDTMFWSKIDKTRAFPKFLYYQLSVIDFMSLSIGSAVPSMTVPVLNALEITLPPLNEQKSIADALSALDDRISLLRETNTTLEAIAQALFKSWFVDFDPVRAKQQGIAPQGMDAATAALFPDSFEESELGEVPKGWRVDSIYTAAKLIYGAPFASSKFNSTGDGKPLVRIRDLKDESPIVFTPEVHPKGYLLKPGDIVVGMDGEFRAYLWGGEESWLNQRVCVFAPLQGLPSTFVHRAIMPILAAVEASETATTVIHLGKNDIDRFRIIVPNQAILTAFGEITDLIYKRIVEQKQMARTLATLRDTLLPRLISGQLRLPL